MNSMLNKIFCKGDAINRVSTSQSSILISLLFLFFIHTAHAGVIKKDYLPRTLLSMKATQYLRIGMTRKQVYDLLGKPTWAKSYKGITLDWTWQNGHCNPVDVTFDTHFKVNGFNEGRAECLDKIYDDLPDESELCTNPKTDYLCHFK